MRNISLRFWILATLLLTVNALCWMLAHRAANDTALPKLRLLSVAPVNDIDQTDRFVLRFDEPVTELAKCNLALNESPFAIEPAPNGHWQWSAPDQLVYLLDEKLPPGRSWTIRPTDDVEVRLGRKLIGEESYSFQTRQLKVKDIALSSSDGSHVNLRIEFNQPVRPADLLRNIKAFDAEQSQNNTDGQQLLTITCPTSNPATELPLTIQRPGNDEIAIHIASNLTGDGGDLTLSKTFKHTIELSEPFTFKRIDVQRPSTRKDISVDVEFTGDIDREQNVPAFTLSPPVENIRISQHSYYYRLTGPFRVGQRYTVVVPQTVLSKDNQTLGEIHTARFDIPNRNPSLSLPISRGILMPTGNLTIDLNTVNVKSFKLKAWRLHTNNLVAHLSGRQANVTSRELFEKPFKLTSHRNKPQTVALELKQLINEQGPGIYRVEVRAESPRWTRDTATIAVTDIALTTKLQKDKLHIWATSLRTGKPIQGATINGFTYNNQMVAEATTDQQGLAQLPAPRDHPDGPVWLVTCKKDDDLSYIQPQKRQWVLDHVDQSGRSYPATYDVMLYTERGVYRPGDTVHITGIIREPNGQIPSTLPLSLRVIRPDGKQIADTNIVALTTTNISNTDSKATKHKRNFGQQGIFHIDFPTNPDGQLGSYNFQVGLTGSKTILGKTTALVEAFVPVRLEVNANPTKQTYTADDKPSLDIHARYLFGQPASKLPFKSTSNLHALTYKSKQFPEFSFNTAAPKKTISLGTIKSNLDQDGKATVTPDFKKEIEAGSTNSTAGTDQVSTAPDYFRMATVVTVTEPGGRSVSTHTSAIVDHASAHLGVKLKANRFVQPERPFTVNWRLLNADDTQLVAKQITIELKRIEYDWQLEQVNGKAVWKTIKRYIDVANQVKTINPQGLKGTAPGTLKLTCPQGGTYELTLSETKTNAKSILTFVATNQANEHLAGTITQPQRIDLTLDRPRYKQGESAILHIATPFTGSLLLTVETDRVIHRLVKQLDTNTTTIQLPVSAEIRGSAYITASVIRGIDPTKSKWLPHRALGMTKLLVNHSDSIPNLHIDTPDQAEPGETVEVNVTAQGDYDINNPPMIHVWAVDDGVLLTTKYDTPSPDKHFFAPRKSVVASADIYAELAPDHKRSQSMQRIGAGGDYEGKDGPASVRLRRSPVPMKQKTPAVVWRAAVPLGPGGRTQIKLEMPQMTGRMRIMAVLVDHDRYASTDRSITLTAPLLVESSWPRFAALGDTFDIPVKLFNNHTAPINASLNIKLAGPIEITNFDHEKTITIQSGQQTVFWLQAKATGLGPVTATINATAPLLDQTRGQLLKASSKAMLAIRPAAPLHSESRLIQIQAGDTFDIKLPDIFDPAHSQLSLQISGNPNVNLKPAVEQLLGYPYGCVEQTTSKLLVLLHAAELLTPKPESLADKTSTAPNKRGAYIDNLVNAGIARLWSMQTKQGGLAYWPGGRQSDQWGTAYAAAFLAQAKSAGYVVDSRFIEELSRYLLSQLNSNSSQHPDDNTRALYCHVLASFGKPQRGWMIRLTELTNDLDMAGRANLAAAWLATGRRDKAAGILIEDTVNQRIVTATTGRFTSQIRQEAVLLNVMLDLDPNHAWNATLAHKLQSARSNSQWGTTLNNASALSALTKYQNRRTRRSAFTGSISSNNRSLLTFSHKQIASLNEIAISKPLHVETHGTGDVFISVSTEGLTKTNTIKPYDRNLKVRRRWTNDKGIVINPAKLTVGDLVHVEVEISAPGISSSDVISNVAIVDLLPASCEVENPRLATSATSNSRENRRNRNSRLNADRVEFLDDRVVLFTPVYRKPRYAYYAIRVTTNGKFTLPPIQASCMYDPAFASLSDAGVLDVKR